MRNLCFKNCFIFFLQFAVSFNSFGQYVQVGTKLVGIGGIGGAGQGKSLSLSSNGNLLAIGGAGDNAGTGAVWLFTNSGTNWSQSGNKLVGTSAVGSAFQGNSISLSSDGGTLAVGGNGDNSSIGAIWVFTNSGGNWFQVGNKIVGNSYIGMSSQGVSVSLSSNGKTLAVGGYGDNSYIGAVWVYTFSGTNWTQIGNKIVANDAIGAANQGISVSISGDGTTLAFGGESDNSGIGAAWVYTLSGSNWKQLGNKIVGTGGVGIGGSHQGQSISLSLDGKTLAVGGNGDSTGNGAVWVYTLSGANWNQVGNKLVGIGGINGIQGSSQGSSVSVSSNGKTLAVGGYNDNSGIGAFWVYTFTGNNWIQVGNKYIGSGFVGSSRQGISISLSSDGSILAEGGDSDNSEGAVWIYRKTTLVTEIEYSEASDVNMFKVYPNPSPNSFTIESLEDYPYTIIDLQGNILENGNTSSRSIGSKLISGLYQLKVNNQVYKVMKIETL